MNKASALSAAQARLVDQLRDGGRLEWNHAAGRYYLSARGIRRIVHPPTVDALLRAGVISKGALGVVTLAEGREAQ